MYFTALHELFYSAAPYGTNFDQCAILVSTSLSLQKDDQQELELYAARKNQGLSDQIFRRKHRFKKGAACASC